MESIENNILKTVELEKDFLSCVVCHEHDVKFYKCFLCSALHCWECSREMFSVACFKMCNHCKKIYLGKKHS